MKFSKAVLAGAAAATLAVSAFAAVTAEEAKQLGTTHTPWGALKAGNADGSFPAWNGGLKTPPAGFKADSGEYLDPFAGEKPAIVIDAKSMDKYADKLPESTKFMMKRYPQYHINVYPTHRVDWATKSWEENSVRNATRAKLTENGNAVEGAFAGVPFPLPKNGAEVMWNAQIKNRAPAERFNFQTWLTDSSGRTSMLGEWDAYFQCDYCDPTMESKYDGYYSKFHTIALKPARSSGEQNIQWVSTNPFKTDTRAWAYMAGQRRVRLAPEFSYDTPAAPYAGAILFDEIGGFSGKMDRFVWKLVGQKEMYVPANGYQQSFPKSVPAGVSKVPGMPDPDYMRYELRRVWVVEGTRAPGARHIYSKRLFYIDADNWQHVQTEAYDDSGKLMRAFLWANMFLYDKGVYLSNTTSIILDLIKGQYVNGVQFMPPRLGGYGMHALPKARKEPVTAEHMAATGVR